MTRFLKMAIAVTALAVALAGTTLAVDCVWDGDTSSDWSDTNNWVNGIKPSTTSDNSIFTNTVPLFQPQITNNTAGYGLKFYANGGTWTLSSSGAYYVSLGSPANQFVYDNAQVLISCKVNMVNAVSCYVYSGATLTISGVVQGNYKVTKAQAGTLVLSNTANTYGSFTAIAAGKLQVASVADAGVNSSLGAPTLASGNANVQFSGAGPTLEFIGSVSCSSDRSNVLTSSATADGMTLEASGQGSAAVVYKGNLYSDSRQAVTPVNLTGANTGTNTYSGIIADRGSTNATSLVKSNAGRWILAGANTYSGPTTVFQGTLAIDGNQVSATGAVSVAAPGTLAGAGTVGGNTTISGSHTPGNAVGIQTFASNLTYASGAHVTWELAANTVAQGAPAVFDQVVVSGDLDFPGATSVALVFNSVGSTVDWSNAFWLSNHEWLVYDVGGALSSFGNLSLTAANWADSHGALFASARPQSRFYLAERTVGTGAVLRYEVKQAGTVVSVH